MTSSRYANRIAYLAVMAVGVFCVYPLTPHQRLDRPLKNYLGHKDDSNLVDLWEQYKVMHDKVYKPGTDIERKKVFVENVLRISEHNKLYYKGRSTYRMELNKFCDWTVDEFIRVYTGMGERNPTLKLNMRTSRWYSRGYHRSKRAPGDGIDLRDTGCVMAIKDQNPCATCWAYTAVTSVEYSYCKKKCGDEVFSEQELIDCSDAQGNEGCNGGGWYHFAWDYVSLKKGMSTAIVYPQVDKSSQKCKKGRPKKRMTNMKVLYITQNNEDEMRLFIDQVKRPIAVALHISWEWMFYAEGIFDHPACMEQSLSYHGMSIVGYGTENGHDFWIGKNSWSTDWGEEGYLRIRRNSNQCGLAAYPMGLKLKCASGGKGYDCEKNSPCNAANRKKNQYYFTYSKSNKSFVQCGITNNQCYVMPCANGTKWSQKFLTCTL